jgi:hypothetical protein
MLLEPMAPGAPTSANQPRYLLLRWQPPIRRELVNRVWEHLGQLRQDLISREAGAPGKIVDNVRTEGIRDLTRRDALVRPGVDLGIDRAAETVLLELFE